MERTARYVLVSPLDHEEVLPSLVDDIIDVVLAPADVLDPDLFAGQVRPEDADHQHVVTCRSRNYTDQFSDHFKNPPQIFFLNFSCSLSMG